MRQREMCMLSTLIRSSRGTSTQTTSGGRCKLDAWLVTALGAEVWCAEWMVRCSVMTCFLRYLCAYGVLRYITQSLQSSEKPCMAQQVYLLDILFFRALVHVARNIHSLGAAVFSMHLVTMACKPPCKAVCQQRDSLIYRPGYALSLTPSPARQRHIFHGMLRSRLFYVPLITRSRSYDGQLRDGKAPERFGCRHVKQNR